MVKSEMFDASPGGIKTTILQEVQCLLEDRGAAAEKQLREGRGPSTRKIHQMITKLLLRGPRQISPLTKLSHFLKPIQFGDQKLKLSTHVAKIAFRGPRRKFHSGQSFHI